MKTLFTLLLSMGSFTALFAQGGHDNRDNSYAQRGHEVVMNNDRGRDYQRDNVSNYPYSNSNSRDWDRRNGDYGRRDNNHGYNQPVYDRDRRGVEMQRNRKSNNGSFVKGAVVGGVAGVLLGVLLSK